MQIAVIIASAIFVLPGMPLESAYCLEHMQVHESLAHAVTNTYTWAKEFGLLVEQLHDAAGLLSGLFETCYRMLSGRDLRNTAVPYLLPY